MKSKDSSKSSIIRSQSELVARFCDFLREDPDLHWDAGNFEPSSSLKLNFDGHQLEFQPLCKLKPSVPWVESLQEAPSSPHPLVVTPELSQRVVSACKERGIGSIDLNGRTWLRAPGLLVDRRPLPGRSFRYELEPRNIFVGKSVRIVRCLLTDRARLWTQAEILLRTGASSGLVSRIVQHLISQGFVEKVSAREFRLRDWQGLLDEWVASDSLSKRTSLTRYAGLPGSTQEVVAQRLQQWAAEEKVPLAFTQFLAAWNRHPYTAPVVCSAYVSRLPDSATLERWGLRPVEEGGKLWVLIPDDEGILKETQSVNGLPLVTDAQIYVDLQRTGLRGPEAAGALREWNGFCLP